MGVYDYQAETIDGQLVPLSHYSGKALLIVNTASECGFTPQYKNLEALYQMYKARGFEVLAFPSNDFGAQEPGTSEQIKTFCETRYKTTFPLFAKISIKGEKAHPLYKYLTGLKENGGEVTWNFNKFLVSHDGRVVAHFASKIEPLSEELKNQLESVLPRS